MIIRKATLKEMQKLWDYSCSNTYNYFVDGITNQKIEFWCIDNEGIIGELYIFWESEDNDEANGVNRAYLCALRIKEEYQNKGLSSKLMKKVLERIQENGFNEVTIGIDNDNYNKLKQIYNKWGFTELVKNMNCDYHYINSDGSPTIYDEIVDLYLKRLR